MALTLTSPAFASGGRIPDRHTCDGEDLSPPLDWTGAPPETRGFALVCSDPDAPAGTFYHWAVHGIPADAKGVAEGQPVRGSRGLLQAVNDFRRMGYRGPCPPRGHGVHHYHFTLYALPVDALPVGAAPGCREVERAARAAAIARAELIGTCER